MQAHATMTGALMQMRPFKNVDPAIVMEAEKTCTWHKLRRHEMLFASGEISDTVYFVVSGLVGCIYHSASGRLITLAEIGAGNMVGELAAIDGRPRTVDVVALADTVFAAMPGHAFREILKHGYVALGILREMSERMRTLTDRMVELSTLDVGTRLRCELLRIAAQYPMKDRQVRFPAPRHADLAARISANREAVTRELARLTRIGLIEKHDRDLVICSLPEFRQSLADLIAGLPQPELEPAL